MKKKLTILALVLALGAGALSFAPIASAYETYCWRCTYIWFNGSVCDPAPNGGEANCNDSGPTCLLFGGTCLLPIAINR